VEKELRSLGFEVRTQRFRTPLTSAWSEFFDHLILLFGVLVFPLSGHLSIACIVLGFLLFLFEEYGRSPFAWLSPHRESGNVVAVIPPTRQSRLTLVVAAHIDSPRSAFFYHPSLARFFRLFKLLDFACQALLFMLFVFAYGGYLLKMDPGTQKFLWHIGLLLAIFPLLALVATFGKAAGGKATPGGNDNASGGAGLLELARFFSHLRPLNVEVWLVGTGASDACGMGIRRLVAENRKALRGAFFIVLEQVGTGNPVCYRREGKLITFRANRRLLSFAKDVSSNHGHFFSGFKRNSLYAGEGFHLISRGKKAITVSARGKSGIPGNWRWHGDGYDKLDPRSLRLAYDFVRSLIDRLDRSDLKR
jgi:hypothetical protein